MDPLARRAAARTERAFDALNEVFLDPPGGRIELLLTDHTEESHGFATAVPYNHIVVSLRPPMEGAPLSHFDDWMELIITHELVYVFQLDHTGPIGSMLRSVLGRWEAGWPAFPGFDLPRWTTEGLATYYESSLTTSGRLRGTYIDMVLRAAVLEDDLERLDDVFRMRRGWEPLPSAFLGLFAPFLRQASSLRTSLLTTTYSGRKLHSRNILWSAGDSPHTMSVGEAGFRRFSTYPRQGLHCLSTLLRGVDRYEAGGPTP